MASSTPTTTTISNVRIFGGVNDGLSDLSTVTIEDGLITTIANAAATVTNDSSLIDGGGRTLMPGIIEGHTHLSMAGASVNDLLTQLPGYAAIVATVQARLALMNGVTTVRDMGGEVFTLKRAIEEGLVPGPRIYPSGALISQTSGHGDYRFPNQLNPALGGPIPTSDVARGTALVDGVPRMLAAAREQLRLGASQIKVCIGGGVASPTDATWRSSPPRRSRPPSPLRRTGGPTYQSTATPCGPSTRRSTRG